MVDKIRFRVFDSLPRGDYATEYLACTYDGEYNDPGHYDVSIMVPDKSGKKGGGKMLKINIGDWFTLEREGGES